MAKQTNCLQNIRNEIERIIGEAIKAGGLPIPQGYRLELQVGLVELPKQVLVTVIGQATKTIAPTKTPGRKPSKSNRSSMLDSTIVQLGKNLRQAGYLNLKTHHIRDWTLRNIVLMTEQEFSKGERVGKYTVGQLKAYLESIGLRFDMTETEIQDWVEK